ncbi:hypothetical protein OPU71_12440 [Niveibacterium sp. 24ML]|uniref:InlB B-repeat-containing protein n=1 Tax=Niveibacterium sp. 24ML TaxID=2985512 RepID=UPI00226EC318|nr:hypothetical protein [Niveibacterium sp. 24ML]MCX9156934.1 hypothetical protein [Niveibacterium sp. 24ML]
MTTFKVSVTAGDGGFVAFRGEGEDEQLKQVENEFAAATDVEIAMIPQRDHTVACWHYNGTEYDGPGRGPSVDGVKRYFRINGIARHAVVNVSFVPLTATVLASPARSDNDPGGYVSPSYKGAPFPIEWGKSKQFRAHPSKGFEVDRWVLDGKTAQVGAASFTLQGPRDDKQHHLTVEFAKKAYVIKPVAGPHGAIDPSEPFKAEAGRSYLFTAVPHSGYRIKQWLRDGSVVAAEDLSDLTNYPLDDVSANHTVTVQFEPASLGLLREATATVTAEVIGKARLVSYPRDSGITYEVPLYRLRLDGTDADGRAVSHDFRVARYGVGFTDKDTAPYICSVRAGRYLIKRWITGYAKHGAWVLKDGYFLHAAQARPEQETGLNGCVGVYGPNTLKAFNEVLCALMNVDADEAGRKAIAASGKFVVVVESAKRPPLKPWGGVR